MIGHQRERQLVALPLLTPLNPRSRKSRLDDAWVGRRLQLLLPVIPDSRDTLIIITDLIRMLHQRVITI